LKQAVQKQVSRLLAALIMLIPLLYCSGTGKAFLTIDEEGITNNGYASQVAYILAVYEDGGSMFDLEPLFWIHGIRTAIALGFGEIDNIGGPMLTASIMLAFTWPLLALFDTAPRRTVAFLIPLAVMALSYRAVFVFVAIGYLLLYVLRQRSAVYLVFSFIFAALSSGAVLSALMIALLLAKAYERLTFSMRIYILFMAISLGISFADKYTGFMAQEAGYDSTVQGATGITALLSRSTIFVSFDTGDYLRGIAYLVMLAGACYAVVYATLRKQYSGYAAIFVSTIPAFFLEGLGVISLVVPVFMFLAGVHMPRRLNPGLATMR